MVTGATARGLALAALVHAGSCAASAGAIEPGARFEPPAAAPGQRVRYVVTLTGEPLPEVRTLPQPELGALELVAGPFTATSRHVRLTPRGLRESDRLTITWHLTAGAAGRHRVPEFTVQVGRERVVGPAAELEVRAREPARPSGQGSAARPRDPFAREPAPRTAAEPAHVAVRAVVDDDEPWVGQEIVVTHLLEFDGSVAEYGHDPVAFPGFERQPLEVDRLPRRVQGERWHEASVTRWRLVPQVPGDRVLPPVEYRVVLEVADEDLFRSMLAPRRVEHGCRTAPLPLRVRPLPGGAPASFTGAVGSFRLEARLSSSSIALGDGTALELVVKGTGNFATVKAPALSAPAGLQVFEPEVTEDVRPDRTGHSTGVKVFTYPILGRAPGEHELPPVAWSCFDPRSGRHVTRTTGSFVVAVSSGDAAAAWSGAAPLGADRDIHHVVASWAPSPAASGGAPVWFWIVLPLGPAGFLIAALGRRARAASRRSGPGARSARDASRRARSRLEAARAARARSAPVEAADHAARAISGLVHDRLGPLPAEPSPAETGRRLSERLGEDLGRRTARCLERCDFVRFAASASPAEVQSVLGEASVLLSDLERALRRRDRGPAP